MILSSPYAVYVFAAYGVALAILGGLGWAAWRDWRRVKAAWARAQGGKGAA